MHYLWGNLLLKIIFIHENGTCISNAFLLYFQCNFFCSCAAPTLILWHGHSLPAAGNIAVLRFLPKLLIHHETGQQKERVSREANLWSDSSLHLYCLFSILFYSILVYSILFFVDMVVFLSPWPQGHLRFRSRCVETDCSTSRPSVKFVSSHSHENRPIVSSCTRPERST